MSLVYINAKSFETINKHVNNLFDFVIHYFHPYCVTVHRQGKCCRKTRIEVSKKEGTANSAGKGKKISMKFYDFA